MSFGRSASGPSGLSINTGTANLFGTSASQAPAAGGLFGSTSNQSSQPAQPGSLFGTASSQPQTSGSLLGSAQAQQTGGLFGPTATTASQPQQSGGLFGSTSTSQPQQPGGLFGNSTAQQQKPGGLFGTTATSQPQQSGGLFGAVKPAQPSQPGGIFGSSATQQQQPQQGTGGLFGSSMANASGGLGQATTQPQAGNPNRQSGLGFGLTMGQGNQQQQQVIPGVRIDVSNIRSTTRFNDLQEDLQNRITEIERAIQGFIGQKNELDAFMPAHGEQVLGIPGDVGFVSRKAAGVEDALAGDAGAVKQLRELVKTDADNAQLSFRAVDNLKLPTAYHQAGLWSTRGQQGTAAGTGSGDADGDSNPELVGLFSKTADEMGDTMQKFEKNLGEIEMHLHAVQGNVLERLQRVAATPKDGTQSRADEKIVELAAVLRDFEESILQVAGSVGGAREGVTALQLGELLGERH